MGNERLRWKLWQAAALEASDDDLVARYDLDPMYRAAVDAICRGHGDDDFPAISIADAGKAAAILRAINPWLASERSRADRLEQDLERVKAENERLERALAEEHDAVQYLRAALSILIPEDYEAADGSIEAALIGGKWLWTEDEAHSVLDGLPRLIGTRPTLLASVEENRQ